MKKFTLLMLMSALILAGCNQAERPGGEAAGASGEAEVQEEVSAERVRKEVGEAWEATASYFTRERDQAQVEINEATRKIDRRIDKLREDLKTATRDERQAIERELGNLQNERNKLEEIGDKVKNTSQAAWQDIKQSWRDIRKGAEERLRADEPAATNAQ